MEVDKEQDFHYWKVIPRENGWVECLELQFPKGTQGDKLRAMREFRKFEHQIAEEGFRGWLAWTDLSNFKMLKLFDALGGSEYYVDKEGKVFFCKYCNNGVEEK